MTPFGKRSVSQYDTDPVGQACYMTVDLLQQRGQSKRGEWKEAFGEMV